MFALGLLAVLLFGTLQYLKRQDITVEPPRLDYTSEAFPVQDRVARFEQPDAAADSGLVRNVVLFLADGMGTSMLSATSALEHGPAGAFGFERMEAVGLMRTYSANDLVTDSAAGATALASGYKANNRMVGATADGPVESIAERLKAQGFAVGLVTSSYVTDASIGAFAAHVANRDSTQRIARQLATSPMDLIIGGADYSMSPDVLELARSSGFVVSDEIGFPQTAPEDRLLVTLPGRSFFGYAGPPLEDVTRFAFERLAATGRPFFLFIEQEETDTAGHRNNLGRVRRGMVELDAAVTAGLQLASDEGDTLVLLTADHDTGGVGITQGKYRLGEAIVHWLTTKHTSQYVPFFAQGPGSHHFEGIFDNTEVPSRLANLLGIGPFPSPVRPDSAEME